MMATTLATTEDAGLILQLYDLRREATMRAARKWVLFEFRPESFEEMLAVQRASGSQENAYWRQVVSYWEMAHSFVLRGAIDADLFLDSQGEGIFLYAKFSGFLAQYKETTGNPFMRHTAELVERYPAAKDRFNAMVKGMAVRRAEPKP